MHSRAGSAARPRGWHDAAPCARAHLRRTPHHHTAVVPQSSSRLARAQAGSNGNGTGSLSTLSSYDEYQLSATSTPVQIAWRARTLGFGFSAGGLLFPYFLGVAKGLRDVGALTDESPVAGASAGSLIAACVKTGLTHDQLVEACLQLAAECRAKGTRHNLGPVLQRTLERVLPEDAHERANARNVHVAVTRLQPSLQPLLINRFESREDLIQSLLTSCHIPWYLNGSLTTQFRGAQHVDGGLTNFIPTPPTGTTHNVRICCFPQRDMRRSFGDLCIAPDTFDPSWPHDLRTMLSWAFHPADGAMLEQLLTKGERDAAAWALKHQLPVLAPSAATTLDTTTGSRSPSASPWQQEGLSP